MKQFRKWAGVILRHEDEILFCKRAPEKSLGGVWSIPSGKIENGENPGQAAIREFHEETDIELDTNLQFVGFLDKFSKEGLKKGHMFVFCVLYVCFTHFRLNSLTLSFFDPGGSVLVKLFSSQNL